MTPTPDSFRALARSSPWRWTTLHFTHRDDAGEVEAWVRRPGWLRVRRAGEPDVFESGVPYTRTRVLFTSDAPDYVLPATRIPQDVEPVLRLDGLVAERPEDWSIDYDDPMYGNYTWVAMLDPVELSDGVDVSRPQVDEVQGRPVWRADLVAVEGYEARCGAHCCELLWSDVSRLSECGGDLSEAPDPPTEDAYPEFYDVSLDVQTGIVVRCHPVGGRGAPWLEVDIHEVDTVLDHLFPS